MTVKRRQFIADSVRLALGGRAAALLSGLVPATVLAERSLETFSDEEARRLTVFTRALFPFSQLDDSHYLEVVEHLDKQPAELVDLIRSGLSRLDGAVDGNWLEASVDDKLRAMEALQSDAFFGAVLNQTIDVLFRNPDVWKLVGYQGSSIEFGGYLYRGFDDIDWLPPGPGS